MKILKGRVDWMEGHANRPELILLVDRIPTSDEMRFTLHDKGGTIDGGLYFAESGGYCRFFSHYGNPNVNGGGYGGATFNITMIDGTRKTLHGPWSSNAGEMNERGFGPCTEALVTTDPRAFDGNHRGLAAGSVLLSKLREAISCIDVGTGYTWRPGAHYASEIVFPEGSRFALACSGKVRVDHRGGTDYKLVARPEVFDDGTLIENIRAAINAALVLDSNTAQPPMKPFRLARWPGNAVGYELAREIAERYRRHVPFEPLDTLLTLTTYEPAVQFPDGDVWVKPASE